MTHGLAEQHFHSYKDAKKWLDSWITSKDESFFRHGIRMLPERWEKVVASDGQYFQCQQRDILYYLIPHEKKRFTNIEKANAFHLEQQECSRHYT
jgi:hypothetical protein